MTSLKFKFLVSGILLSQAVFYHSALSHKPISMLRAEGHPKILKDGAARETLMIKRRAVDSKARIVTDLKSTADLKLSNYFHFRVLPESLIRIEGPQFFAAEKRFKVTLERGRFFSAAALTPLAHPEVLEVSAGDCRFETRNGIFSLNFNDQSGEVRLAVLRGEIGAALKNNEKSAILVKSSETWECRPEASPQPITSEEWRESYNVYQILPRGEDSLNEIRRCGSLFEKVFFSGDFFTSRNGFLQSRVYQDSGQPHVLEIYYDLQSRGAFTGVYFQMRSLVLEGAYRLRYQSRLKPGEPGPAGYRIEMKSGQKLLKSFSLWNPKPDWEEHEILFQMDQAAEITEVVLLFSDPSAGPLKRGFIQLRNLDLEAVAKPA